jgi:hypothetical protein
LVTFVLWSRGRSHWPPKIVMPACSSWRRSGCLAGWCATVPAQALTTACPMATTMAGRPVAKAKVAANRAREVTAKVLRAAMTSVAAVAKRATGPVSAVRRGGMRQPKSMWPRGTKKSKAFSWPTASSSPLHPVHALHQRPQRATTSTSKSSRCLPISEKLKMVTGVDGPSTLAPPTT